jgi:hypothetical protein
VTATSGGGKGVEVGKTDVPPGPQEVRKKKTAIRFNQRRNFMMNLSVITTCHCEPFIGEAISSSSKDCFVGKSTLLAMTYFIYITPLKIAFETGH